jgi:hypothetical protein
MYHITYKNILKSNKGHDDFAQWLKTYWPTQQKWGATSVTFWDSIEGDKKILLCRYTVKNLDQWNQRAMGPEAETLVKALGEVVDMDQISIKITAA